jgi:hypothetical protein
VVSVDGNIEMDEVLTSDPVDPEMAYNPRT